MIAVATAVELLQFQPVSDGTYRLFAALTRAAKEVGIDLIQTHEYQGRSPWLMLWGPGAPNRFEAMRRQVAAGGHVLAWDAAYWHRDRQHRISIDAAHPQAWVMRKALPDGRLQAHPVPVADRWNPEGPVIVAGIGAKATAQYGSAVQIWEDLMIAQCQAQGWPVLYRAKPNHPRAPAGVSLAHPGPIDQVLSGASLVITWHSNVAVDAIRLGIPVVCRDGAAKAVYPGAFHPTGHQPIPPSVRDQFLANLAWFQWAPREAADCWRFLLELLA